MHYRPLPIRHLGGRVPPVPRGIYATEVRSKTLSPRDKNPWKSFFSLSLGGGDRPTPRLPHLTILHRKTFRRFITEGGLNPLTSPLGTAVLLGREHPPLTVLQPRIHLLCHLCSFEHNNYRFHQASEVAQWTVRWRSDQCRVNEFGGEKLHRGFRSLLCRRPRKFHLTNARSPSRPGIPTPLSKSCLNTKPEFGGPKTAGATVPVA